MQASFSIGAFLGILFRRVRFLAIGTFLIALAAAVVSLTLIPRQYLSSASLLPEEQETASPIAALLGQTGLPFAGFGGGGSAELHREILASYGICREVVESLNLYAAFELESLREENPLAAEQEAVNFLQESLRVEIDDRSGVLRLIVVASDPELARDIVERLMAELDRFNREKVQETGRRKLRFLSGRAKQAEIDLKAARQALQAFGEEEGIVHLPAEVETELALVAELNRRLVLKNLERASVAMDAAGESPALRRVDAEIAVLREQLAELESGDGDSDMRFKPLSELPELSLRYYRLRREMTVQEEIGDMLTQQMEQARLQAENDVSTLKLLDTPRVPTLPVWPRKKLIVIAAAMIGFLALALWVLWRDFLERVRRGEGERWASWQWLPGTARKPDPEPGSES